MAATRGLGDRPRPHCGLMGSRRPATFHGSHTEPRGPATPPRQPHGTQGTGQDPTAATRGPGNWPRPYGSHTGPRRPATPPRRPHGPRGLATIPRRQHGAQETGQAFTAAPQGSGDRPHDAQGIGQANTATPRVKGTGHASTAITLGPGDRPRPYGNHTGPRGPVTPSR